jgi:hypothetical protein
MFRILAGSICAAVLTVLTASAQAAILQNNTYISGSNETALAVSSTDLVNQGQPTFLTETSVGFTPFSCCGGTASTSYLNDGSAGTNSTSAGTAFDLDGTWTTTYALNLSTNTMGYDITGVNSFTGWPDSRTDQKYELLYSTVAAPSTFLSLGTFSFLPNGGGSAEISLTDSTGVIATHVAAVQFSIQSPASGSESVYRELDVIGRASVPEPSSIALGLIGGLGLLVMLRRRRQA